MLVVPYKSKNPPEHTPYVTYALIAINCLIFLITSNWADHWPEIRWGVVLDWAVSRSTMNPLRLFTSLFLHENLLHIGGNMLFLWIFGAAAEGRLRPLKFTALYLGSGMIGGYIQSLAGPQFGLGASGAIMGVAGSYVYMFPHAKIRVFRWIRLLPVIADWPAWGTVAYFIFFDILNGLILRGSDHTGHFTHLSGFLIGLLATWLFRARRDTEAMSEVQATRSELSNELELMSYAELDVLMDAWTDNMELVLTYCNKALAQPGTRGEQKAAAAIERYKQDLLMYSDPEWVASTLLKIPQDSTYQVSGPFYLKLGSKLESVGNYQMAATLYRRIFDIDATSKDSSAAIIRFGRIWEQVFKDKEMARDAYEVYLRLFPKGPMAEEAEKGLDRVGGRRIVTEITRQATIKKTYIHDEDAPIPRITAFDDDAEAIAQNHGEQAAQSPEPKTQPHQVKLSVPNPFGE